jgi:3-dehydroquinate dehydratase I
MKPRGVRMGTVTLERHAPTVIASFTDRTPLATLRSAAEKGLDLAEARVDLFRERDSKKIVRFVREVATVVPVLATLRSTSEGGKWNGDDGEGLALYRELLPQVAAIDIELASPIRAATVQVARRHRRSVVLSHHDFNRTPADAELDRVIAQSRSAGADITKIATLVKSEEDVARLAALFARHAEAPLVVIGMGEIGKKTRIFFPALGSLFTFASLDQTTAPGQLKLAETVRELKAYYPAYGRAPRQRRSAG